MTHPPDLDELTKLEATMKTTEPMRSRIRELSNPDRDDYDRAVILLCDDFDSIRNAAKALIKRVRAAEGELIEQANACQHLAEAWKSVAFDLTIARANAQPDAETIAMRAEIDEFHDCYLDGRTHREIHFDKALKNAKLISIDDLRKLPK